jgi:DhnA family fructose-bisphosphate aldolase class Ia
VRGAIDAGAAGVTYGRNIWQDAKPGAMIVAIKAVVHDGATPEEAAQVYEDSS